MRSVTMNPARTSSTALLMMMLALAIGIMSTFVALGMSAGQAYADLNESLNTIDYSSSNAQYEIELTPDNEVNDVGAEHLLTATVTTTGTQPVTGVMVAFSVISGPTVGVTGSARTDANGQAFFSYTGDTVGTDTIEACFTPDSNGSICDQAIKQWVDVTDRTDGDSCQGENSCRGKNITVGDNSCNSENSCGGDNIAIGDNSCNEERACRGNHSVIGDNSCNSEGACRGNGIAVGYGSCNHKGSCRGNNQIVGNGSCNGEESCRGNRNTIGDDSCNEEGACRINNEAIPDNSCNQGAACSKRGKTQEDKGSNTDVEVDDEEDTGKGKGRGKNKD